LVHRQMAQRLHRELRPRLRQIRLLFRPATKPRQAPIIRQVEKPAGFLLFRFHSFNRPEEFLGWRNRS
ncbi:hypothetical protein, partial [Rhizobium rhizoryzae]|uniref:hypothetical protein n=1 Tax=Rhizobium rhizoryzae TaxID=451876 RepID=UPI0028AA08B5